MDSYILGILWSLGRYVADDDGSNYFFVRSADRYYLEILREYFTCSNDIHTVKHKGKPQYRLKIHQFPFECLLEHGWSGRNEEERMYPVGLEDHSAFLRAFCELHATFSYQTSYTKRKEKYYRLRLRIYGNFKIIEHINRVLAAEAGIAEHSAQPAHNKKTAYLQLTDFEELKRLVSYLEGLPKNPSWWVKTNDFLVNPRLEAPPQTKD